MKKFLFTFAVVALLALPAFAQSHRVNGPIPAKAAALKQSVRTLPGTFRSARKDYSPINTFPYVNNFDNGTLGGWYNVDNDNDGYAWSVTLLYQQGYGRNGSDGFASSASYDNDLGDALTPDNWLVSPLVQLPATGAYQLSWYAAALDADYPADHYSVYVSTDSTVTAMANATPVFSETLASDTYTKRSVSLASFAGQNVYIAFRHHSCSDEFVMRIDDIAISVPGAPEVAISMPSVAFLGDTVHLSALLEDGETNGLSYAWTIAGADVTSSNLSQLDAVWNAAGNYTVTLVASNALGSDTATATIRILDCGTVTAFPYLENFETGLNCWMPVDADGDGNGWYGSIISGDATNGVAVSDSYDGDTWEGLTPDNWLIGPAMQIPANANFELSWKVMPSNSSYPAEHYGVFVSTTGSALADFQDSIFVETLTDDVEELTHRVVSLAPYAGQTIRIAFRHYGCEDQLSLVLDDIRVAEMGAPQVAIHGPASARNTDQVTFTSEVVSAVPATSYEWILDGATPSTASTPSVTVSYANEGSYQVVLVVATPYGADTAKTNITIRDCSGTLVAPFTEDFEQGMGCWGSIDQDGDGYGFESFYEHLDNIGWGSSAQDYTHGGTDAMVSWSYYVTDINELGMMGGESLTAHDILVSPAIELAAGQTWKLGFFARSFAESDYLDDLEVRLATTMPTSAADFTTSLMERTTIAGTGHTQYILDLSAYAGQTVYLGFVHQSDDMMALIIDDITVDNDVTGIANAEQHSITLSPNPTVGRVAISAEDVQDVQVLDLSGRVVMSLGGVQGFDASGLPNGAYMVRVATSKGVSVSKLIKK